MRFLGGPIATSDDDSAVGLGFRSVVSPTDDDFPIAALERIPNEALWARTDGTVVDDLAVGVATTGVRAGIAAVVVEAGEMARTFLIDLALSASALAVRIAEVSGRTFALGALRSGAAFGSRAAGVGGAGIATSWKGDQVGVRSGQDINPVEVGERADNDSKFMVGIKTSSGFYQ